MYFESPLNGVPLGIEYQHKDKKTKSWATGPNKKTVLMHSVAWVKTDTQLNTD